MKKQDETYWKKTKTKEQSSGPKRWERVKLGGASGDRGLFDVLKSHSSSAVAYHDPQLS